MLKIAAVVWIMLATTLAGIGLLVVVATPSLAGEAQTLIPIVCSAAIIVAMPLSYVIARRIARATAA